MTDQPAPEQNILPPAPMWQQISAFLLWKYAKREAVEITAQDVEDFMQAFAPAIPVVFVDQRGMRFVLRLVTEAEAMEITKLGAAIEHVGGEDAPGSASLQ